MKIARFLNNITQKSLVKTNINNSDRNSDKKTFKESGNVNKILQKTNNNESLAIGEIMIILPEFSKRSLDDYEFFQPLTNKKTLHLVCPYNSLVGELKERICGLTRIPKTKIRLIYAGDILQDANAIPNEVFSADVSSVDDVFRCRIYLSINESAAAEVIPSESDVASSGDQDTDGARVSEEANDSEPFLEETKENKSDEANTQDNKVVELARVEQELDEIDKLQSLLKSDRFELRRDLRKIDCDKYCDRLTREGYADEGAFSNISDDALRAMTIPRLARVRILALADTIKRRLDILFRERSVETLKMQVERDFVEKGNWDGSSAGVPGQAMTIDGVETLYAKKKDIKDAWLQSLRQKEIKEKLQEQATADQQAEQQLKLYGRPAKRHSDDLQGKINLIRRRCDVDDLGVNTSERPSVPVWKWCCAKHQSDTLALRKDAVESRRRTNAADLKSFLNCCDYFRNGFSSREVLLSAANFLLTKGALRMEESQVLAIIQKAVESKEEQTVHKSWNSAERRVRAQGEAGAAVGLPVTAYSSLKFHDIFLETVAELDHRRLVG